MIGEQKHDHYGGYSQHTKRGNHVNQIYGDFLSDVGKGPDAFQRAFSKGNELRRQFMYAETATLLVHSAH